MGVTDEEGKPADDASVILVSRSMGTKALVGGNAASATTGETVAARFESTGEGNISNMALKLSASGAIDRNVALDMDGGCVTGMAMKNRVVNGNSARRRCRARITT